MTAHAHIVKAHMVIDAIAESSRWFSLQVQVQQPSLFVSLSVEEWLSVKLSI